MLVQAFFSDQDNVRRVQEALNMVGLNSLSPAAIVGEQSVATQQLLRNLSGFDQQSEHHPVR